VIDIVDTLPMENQYEYFKTQVLDIQQLSDYEKFDMVKKMELMGGRKPSQLLHAMMEFFPVGMEKHLSFHYFFMQRLTSGHSWERFSLASRVLLPPGLTSCGLSTQWRKVTPLPRPRQRRLHQPASPPSGVVPEGMVGGAVGKEGPGADRDSSQREPPLPPFQVSLLPTLHLLTSPGPLRDSATSTGYMRTRRTTV
jgi:hypothetical protein